MTQALRLVPTPPSDAELATAAAAGDRAAFAELHRRHARVVHGILVARLPWPLAEEAVQDVFLIAWQKLHSLRDPARVAPWLCQLARNLAVDQLRKRRETAPLPESLPEPHRPTAEAQLVLRHLAALPETYAETLALRLIEGLTGPEIAERTGMTHGSVRVNLTRGMKLLRERLNLEDQ
ncbi:MAG: sigma-70 family RNA polymerase sigma factor [Deltaproteobacteria bacterium]|nr:MAG: sigma-70 family RNA polymerase sigma factor [Deltaproteobacteria bacterium]